MPESGQVSGSKFILETEHTDKKGIRCWRGHVLLRFQDALRNLSLFLANKHVLKYRMRFWMMIALFKSRVQSLGRSAGVWGRIHSSQGNSNTFPV
jgi:hypothetical protein